MVLEAWVLLDAIKANMDERRYELATLRPLSGQCLSDFVVAHGFVDKSQEPVREIVLEQRSADSTRSTPSADPAEQVAADATAVDEEDLQRLRDLGLTEIMDVVLHGQPPARSSPRRRFRTGSRNRPTRAMVDPEPAKCSLPAGRSPSCRSANRSPRGATARRRRRHRARSRPPRASTRSKSPRRPLSRRRRRRSRR